MSNEAIAVTIISSLLSGLIGVSASAYFFYRLERHKLKLDLARRLMGYRFNTLGDEFAMAMNEVVVVFSDNDDVLRELENLYRMIGTPEKPNSEIIFSNFLKSVCRGSGLSQNSLNDAYMLQTFHTRKRN